MADEPDALHPPDAPQDDDGELDPDVRLDLAEERLLHAAAQARRSNADELDPETEAILRERLTSPDGA